MMTRIYKPLLVAAALCCVAGVQAQTIYRIVGPDGKVTFSDKPPVSAEQGKVAGTGTGASSSASGAGLPYELKQAAGKFPVTLYTATKCAPCDSARSMLMGRGIPFSERTVSTNEDIEALQRFNGDASLPAASIGSQRLRGYSPTEWAQYLDAAGYPQTSALPAGYRNGAASPLVAVTKPVAAKAEETAPPTPQPEPDVSPSNPSGIKF